MIQITLNKQAHCCLFIFVFNLIQEDKMLKATEELVIKNYNIKENAFKLYKQALNDVQEEFKRLDEIREFNQLKVLTAFQEERISDSHFTNSTGYAYDDLGREFSLCQNL